MNKGWPTGAVKLLGQRDVARLLDQVEIDQQKELIAKGYFLADKNKLAIQYASEALEKSALHVPYAGWTAGLSAWRLKNYNQAADFFSNFSISLLIISLPKSEFGEMIMVGSLNDATAFNINLILFFILLILVAG